MKKIADIPISSGSLLKIGLLVLGIFLLTMMYYGWTERKPNLSLNISTPELIIPTKCILTSDFENGNIGKVVEKPSNTFTMEFGPGAGGIWFHIRLSGCKDMNLKFILKMTRDLESSAAHWYDGARKNTLVVTHDQQNWEKISSGNLDKASKTFTFTHTPTNNSEWIAYFYPFTNWQLDDFIRDYSTNPNFKSEIIGTTPMGRYQKMITITDPTVSDDNKKVVWIIAREDAWEIASTFNTIGEIKYLLSTDNLVVNLRKNVIFKFIPIVSVDGVSEGVIAGIENGNPSSIFSLTKDWMMNPSSKEVENIKNQMRIWKNSGKKIDVIGRHHNWGFQFTKDKFGGSNIKLRSSAEKYYGNGVTISNLSPSGNRAHDFVLTLYPNVAYFSTEETFVGKTIPSLENFGVNTIETLADYFGITHASTLSSRSTKSTHPKQLVPILVP